MRKASLALRYDSALQTDIGRMRRSNQDSAGSDEVAGLYVVCDGMGGVAGGEIASRIATETFLDVARLELERANDRSDVVESALRRAVAAANRAVLGRAGFDTRLRGMGSTLVALRVEGEALTVVNVGDSRAYMVRNGAATQLTLDHSFVAEQVLRGTMTEHEAASSSLQSMITRAIGIAQDVHPDVFHHALRPNDVILLTSDGLTRHVSDGEIGAIVCDEIVRGPAAVCHQLIRSANERGGTDNITCLLLRVREDT